jgi:hypothetical protein
VSKRIILINQTISLINYYKFDLSQYAAKDLILQWAREYKCSWLYLAVIEAIYQGRLKAISVGQILSLWTRKGIPSYHFNAEFESLICTNVTTNIEEMITGNEDLLKETELHPQVSYHVNSSLKKNQHGGNNHSLIVVHKSPITQFKPLEDYSHCYFQIKALADGSWLAVNYERFP